MNTQMPAISEQKSPYEPTPEQLEREQALHRFNRLFVYVPLILAGVVVLALVLWMLWRVFTVTSDNQAKFYGSLSGLADLILIFFNIIPMMLLCAIGPALFGYLVRNAVKKNKLPLEERRGKLQPLLWRVDKAIAKIQSSLQDTQLQKVAKPVIQGHALAAAIQAMARSIQRIFVEPKE